MSQSPLLGNICLRRGFNPVWHGTGHFYPLVFVGSVLSADLFSKLGYFGCSKDDHFSCFPIPCQTGLKENIWRMSVSTLSLGISLGIIFVYLSSLSQKLTFFWDTPQSSRAGYWVSCRDLITKTWRPTFRSTSLTVLDTWRLPVSSFGASPLERRQIQYLEAACLRAFLNYEPQLG